jgi:GAF domain-containing protein
LYFGVSFGDFLADPDSRSFSRFYTNIDRSRYHTHSVLAVPMLNQQKELSGVIMMVNKRDGEFTADDEELLGEKKNTALWPFLPFFTFLSIIS